MTGTKKIQKGDWVIISKDADITLTYKKGRPPARYLGNDSIWVVDDVFEPESGLINVSLLEGPHPGAYCSNVPVSEVKKVKRGR